MEPGFLAPILDNALLVCGGMITICIVAAVLVFAALRSRAKSEE